MEGGPADTLISDILLSGLREYISVALSHQICGDFLLSAAGNEYIFQAVCAFGSLPLCHDNPDLLHSDCRLDVKSTSILLILPQEMLPFLSRACIL